MPTQQVRTVADDGQIIYKCHGCGAEGVKLWRDYNTMVCYQEFYCVECVCKHNKCSVCCVTDPAKVDANGRHECKYGWTDQINGFVPCVTSDDGEEIWGYCAVPADRVQWWRDLPLRPVVSGDTP